MRGEWLNKDFYGILGVDPASAPEGIKRAFRARLKAAHPDRHFADPTAEALTKSLNEANGVLSDPASREEYDEHLREVAQAVRGGPTQSANPPPHQPGPGRDAPPWRGHVARGSDFRWTAQSPGSVLARGGLVDLEVGYCSRCNGCGQLQSQGRALDCPDCDGTAFTTQSPGFSVAVPPGVASGAEIRYPGMGGRSREGGESGDLIVCYVAVPDSSTSSPQRLGDAAGEPARGWVRVVAVALGLICTLALVSWGWRVADNSSQGPQAPDPSGASSSAGSASPTQELTPSPVIGYSRYGNDRFGFAVDVPNDWMADPESGSGDGIVQRSPDGLGVLTVFGANNLGGDSVESASDASQEAVIRGGGQITYADESGEYFTISGYTAERDIFYTRGWVGPGSTNTLTWTYPTVQKEQYDDVVNHVVESLTPGDLESAH